MQPNLHPEVAAEQARRRLDQPGVCNYAYGAVHRTAGRPDPRWCARPEGHEGNHMTAKWLEHLRAQARDRQRRHRERD